VSFGTVVAFNAYLLQFFEPISALGQRYTLLQSAMAGAERVFKLLDTQASDAPVKSSAPATDGGFAFSFENVSFSYKPGAPVLQQVSLNAKRGEKIALVGPTGAGKTTLASLLARWYDAEQGVVRVGGLDVCGMPQAELRGHFAFVPQDVFLFPGTVATNIAVGEEPDRDRVERVLRRIGAWDIFTRRSGGIDCAVEERGVNFSAGERQLIAFARALYRDAPILILDEATASVDSDTEARLQKALGELLKDRTALIIAHRLSTIRASDRILVMHKGRIVEQGTHEQLLAAGALYARLYELQFSRPDQPPPAASAPASQATVESSTRR
jgi:ATP-binding cassette subfamily B protein